MAYFEQRSGAWRAQIRRKGWPAQTRTFDTRADAEKWARAVEREMDVGAFVKRDDSERTVFKDVADRYAREVLPSKRGEVQDRMRLARLVERFGPYSLAAIDGTLLASYRDERLKAVSPQTVVHELNMISRVFKACAMDWGIALPQGIPTAMVRKPKVDNGRERRLSALEERYLLDALANPGGKAPNRWMHPLVVFAIETAARQSELLSLDWPDVDLKLGTARLRGVEGRETKNGAPFREVPLSVRASDVLHVVEPTAKKRVGRVFPMTQNALQLSWTRAVARARRSYVHDLLRDKLVAEGLDSSRELRALVFKKRAPHPRTLALCREIEAQDSTLMDLHFHDLRHEATSRLADVFQLHELMKIIGHSSSKMLARYYHPRVKDLSAKLRATEAARVVEAAVATRQQP